MAEWSLEKIRWQNPRIRSFLGCLRSLDDVLESNFAILHCSPRRFLEMWTEVLKITRALRDEVAPLLEPRSVVPRLERAVREAEFGLSVLELGLLTDLDRFPEHPTDSQIDGLRPELCVAIGKLQSFLQDALGQILAADPRSQHDADYFLSRKFTRDVDEAEWLDQCVRRLDEYMFQLSTVRSEKLAAVGQCIAVERRLPSKDRWTGTEVFLDELTENLSPMLKRTLGLRGVRIDELQAIEGYTTEIPALCRIVLELYETAAGTPLLGLPRLLPPPPPPAAHVLDRLATRMRELDNHLRDLATFIPLWRTSIGQRRALMLRRRGAGPDAIE